MAALTFAALATVLVGCASPTPEFSFPAPAELKGEPVDKKCETLLPASDLADYSPQWTLDPDFRPQVDSYADIAVDIGGIACGYRSAAGDRLVVGFAEPTRGTYWTLIDEITLTNTPTEELDEEAYFDKGNVEIFPYGYWISLTSSTFTEASDAEYLFSIISTRLP